MESEPVKKKWYKRWYGILGIITAVIIVLSAIGGNNPPSPTTEVAAPAPVAAVPATTTAPVEQAKAVAPTPQTFEDRIKALAVRTGTTDISYQGVEDEKADSDRPAGSRMITVKLNVDDFYNKDALIKNTGILSGKIFQETFVSNPKVYDAFVWYYGATTDKYGNAKNDVILVYSIDKDVYKKINWANYDSSKLCDLLKSEGGTTNAGCNVLVNIQ